MKRFKQLISVAYAEDEESDGLENGGVDSNLFSIGNLLSTDDVIKYIHDIDGRDLARFAIRLRFLGQDDPETYIPRDLCYGDCDKEHKSGDECEGVDDEEREQSRFEIKCLYDKIPIRKRDDAEMKAAIDGAKMNGVVYGCSVDFSVQSSGTHDDRDYYTVDVNFLRVS